MWERFKKPAQPKVVFNSGHIGRELTPTSKRRLSDDEMKWVTQSLSANKELKDFLAPHLFAVSKCPCGTCRTVGLDPIALPGREDRSGYIGGITIETKKHGPISVLLHASHGFLVEMEVIWYNFPKPFPESWDELSRTLDSPD